MLPFDPQHIDVAQRRYQAAIDDLLDHRDPTIFTSRRPGLSRKHVFDFEDGIRLIVSRERRVDGAVAIHLSASLIPGPIFERLKPLEPNTAKLEFKAIAENRWRALAGAAADHPCTFLAWTFPKGVPHWWIKP